MIDSILSTDLAWRLGWTLLHSVWQILLIGVLVGFLLAVCSRASANLRYWIACGGLASMFLPLVATFVAIPSQPQIVPPAGAEIVSAERRPAAKTDSPAPPVTPSLDTVTAARSRKGTVVAGGADASLAKPKAEETSQAGGLSATIAPCLPWVVEVWMIGVGLLAIWNIGGWLAVQRLRARATISVAEPIRRKLGELARRMRISRSVKLGESLLVDVPIIIGWLRPMILLPISLVSGLPSSQLDAILAHELAHIRRHDYLVNLLQTLAESLLFYHPAVWLLSRRIRIEREFCCDDAAIEACGNESEYVNALAAVENARAVPVHALPLLGHRPGPTLTRIRRIMGVRGPASHAWIAGSCGILLMLVVGFGVALSQEEPTGDGAAIDTAAVAESGERPETQQQIKAQGQSPIDLDDFQIDLEYRGPSDKPFYHLSLGTAPMKEEARSFHKVSSIDRDQAAAIARWLEGSEFFEHARKSEPQATQRRGAHYILRVTSGDVTLTETLEWDLGLLARLDSMREVLSEDLQSTFDLLLGRLSGYRRIWTEGEVVTDLRTQLSAERDTFPTGTEIPFHSPSKTSEFKTENTDTIASR